MLQNDNCLWCEDDIEKNDWDYKFCKRCTENLEELEIVTRRFSMTEIAEIALKDLQEE